MPPPPTGAMAQVNQLVGNLLAPQTPEAIARQAQIDRTVYVGNLHPMVSG